MDETTGIARAELQPVAAGYQLLGSALVTELREALKAQSPAGALQPRGWTAPNQALQLGRGPHPGFVHAGSNGEASRHLRRARWCSIRPPNYCRTRFVTKRKEGEWFALSPDDVWAFWRYQCIY